MNSLVQLGERQFETREQFLLCRDVPLARCGIMEYSVGEIYDSRYGLVPGGPGGKIYAYTSAEDLFVKETIESLNGKPVTINHPERDVTPENWDELAVGTVINPRRGEGEQDGLLLGDLMITRPDAIERVKMKRDDGGLREVSCGYDAHYDQMADPGQVRKYGLIYNHVALLIPGLARCGSICSIGDSKEKTMSWIDKLKAACTPKDQAAFDAALAEAPTGTAVQLTTDQLRTIASLVPTRDAEEKEEHKKDCDCAKCKDRKTMDAIAHDVGDIKTKVNGLDARVKKMEDEKSDKEEKEDKEVEGRLEEEAPPGSGEKAKKSKDSTYLSDSWQETAAFSEAIAPGMRLPTMDAADNPKKTLDRMCQSRRSALELGANRAELRSFIDGVLGGKEVKSLTCDQVRPIFRAVGQYAMDVNNRATNNNGNNNNQSAAKPKLTLAKLNEMHRELYK